jgi:hypothetical protein
MRVVAKTLLCGSLLLGAAACDSRAEQPATTNNTTVTDVDTLPPDESASTPSEELANGAAEPQGNTADVQP